MGRPMTYDEVMRRSAPQRSACEFDSLSDEADDSDSGDERAVPRRVSPPPPPKTYDEALRPPAVARVVDDHEDASTFASTLSDDASETTEEDPYHEASPSPQRKMPAPRAPCPTPGFVALCFAGRRRGRAAGAGRASYVNNFVYTPRRSPAACIAGRFSIVAVPIVAVPVFWFYLLRC